MDELIKLDQVDEIAINLEPANEIDLNLGEVLGVVRPPELEKVEVTPTKETQVIKPSNFGTYIEEAKVYPIPDEYADITGVTANAEDVLNGKTFVDNQGNEVQGTAELKEDLDTELTAQDEQIERLTIAIDTLEETGSGGGVSNIGTGDYYLKVIDYDGTILAEKRLNNGDTFKLPKSPTHKGLVFQEWSCSQEIVDGVITINSSDVMVGATYTTASGLSEFDITLTKLTGLDVMLNMDGTKNWGDGTSDDLTTHTYTEYGDYTITCNGTTMSTNSAKGLFSESTSTIIYYCTSTRLGAGVTTIGRNAFVRCYSLSSVVIPNTVTEFDGDIFKYCYSLTSVVIPQSVTNVYDSCFSSCYSLTSVVIPQGVTTIGQNTFSTCHSLTSVVIPQSVTTIKPSAFATCYSVIKYDFTQSTTIPTVTYTNAFSAINQICKIYVPDELYDEWIVATNWSTYADYIYKASEMEVSNG